MDVLTPTYIYYLYMYFLIFIVSITNKNVKKLKFCPAEMESFCITLPSNVSSINEKNNTASNYKTKLAMDLILDGNWEIGLSEISYTYSWDNATENYTIYLIDDNGTLGTQKMIFLLESLIQWKRFWIR